MKTIGELIPAAAKFLKEKGVEKARRDVEELLSYILGCKRLDLYLQFDRPLEEKELEHLRLLSKRRVKGEPLEYILGNVQFFECNIVVTPAVLIPRPETEILAAKIAEIVDPKVLLEIWDVCTGSGCLGVSLKKKNPLSTVFLSDLSKEALEIAKENALRNGVKVILLEGDLFSPFAGKKADVIVVNPPYISQAEYEALDPSVRDYEPRMALLGGKDGLEFYRRMAQEADQFLKPGGRLFLEIGSTQGEVVSELFSQGFWKKKFCEKDWAGHDRFFSLEIE